MPITPQRGAQPVAGIGIGWHTRPGDRSTVVARHHYPRSSPCPHPHPSPCLPSTHHRWSSHPSRPGRPRRPRATRRPALPSRPCRTRHRIFERRSRGKGAVAARGWQPPKAVAWAGGRPTAGAPYPRPAPPGVPQARAESEVVIGWAAAPLRSWTRWPVPRHRSARHPPLGWAAPP